MISQKLYGVIIIHCLLLAVIFIGCSGHPFVVSKDDPQKKLYKELDYHFQDPNFENAFWGVAIKSLETGEFLYLHNENKEFTPASNLKLFTTAAALLGLGPQHHFATKLLLKGTLSTDGTFNGDLIIIGYGDPSVSARFASGKATTVFESWADSLKAKGIQTIAGNIVGDDNYFNDNILGLGWSWDDQTAYYAAQISALSFNDNCLSITFTPGDSIGSLVRYKLNPNTQFVNIINHVKTGGQKSKTQISLQRERNTNNIMCNGLLSINDIKKQEWFSIENPTLFAATVFKEVLQSNGLTVNGCAKDIDDLDSYSYQYQDTDDVIEHYSPPLEEIITSINKDSHNLYAELLFRVLGKEISGEGNALKATEDEKAFFYKMGINSDLLKIVDGSGLSRLNLLTPMSVIKLLSFMRKHKYGPTFYNSLSIAGIDGTLQNRMRGTAAQGNVHAKTGYIDGVRALSGFITTQDGEELVFSMICNHYTVPTDLASHLQDSVCELLANFSR